MPGVETYMEAAVVMAERYSASSILLATDDPFTADYCRHRSPIPCFTLPVSLPPPILLSLSSHLSLSPSLSLRPFPLCQLTMS